MASDPIGDPAELDRAYALSRKVDAEVARKVMAITAERDDLKLRNQMLRANAVEIGGLVRELEEVKGERDALKAELREREDECQRWALRWANDGLAAPEPADEPGDEAPSRTALALSDHLGAMGEQIATLAAERDEARRQRDELLEAIATFKRTFGTVAMGAERRDLYDTAKRIREAR